MSGIIMIKTMMGLGVLSIPAVFDTLGLIPGIICLLAVAAISTWAAVQIQHFKINHPGIYGVDDAGEMMVGRIGKEILYVAFILGMSLLIYILQGRRAGTEIPSVDHGGWIWNDQYFHSFERGLYPRNLQCSLHRCGRYLHLHPRQYPNTEQDVLARMDRNRQCPRGK